MRLYNSVRRLWNRLYDAAHIVLDDARVHRVTVWSDPDDENDPRAEAEPGWLAEVIQLPVRRASSPSVDESAHLALWERDLGQGVLDLARSLPGVVVWPKEVL